DALAKAADGKLTTDDIAFSAIEAVADSFHDNHTYYLRPSAYRRYESGKTIGFGYSTIVRPDGLLVWYLIPGRGAEVAGVRPGDVVKGINGQPFDEAGMGVSVRAGETVTMGIDRPGIGALELRATPDEYERPVLTSDLIDGVGYVRLFRFPSPSQ